MAIKVVVIGLEGLNPVLVYPWRIDLPNISSMMDRGIFGRVESTVPPNSAQGWTSSQTGKNPGQFGFWSERYRDDFSYGEPKLASSERVMAAGPLFQILPRYGRKVGMINVPVTYPPPTILNGHCISSLLTRSTKVDFTTPKELKKEIADLFGEYLMDASIAGMNDQDVDREKVLMWTYDADRQKFDILKHFIKSKDCDFLFGVIVGTDRISRLFYRYFDEQHVRYEANAKYREVVKIYYQFCDENIGEILQLIDEKTVLIVLSGHSIQRLEGRINLNEWLLQEGYLALKPRPGKPISLKNVEVDWRRSKAWATGSTGQIYLNVEGREAQGIVREDEYDSLLKELSEKLANIPGAQGRRLETKVFRRDEIHFGNFAQFGPDLFVYFDNCRWNINEAVGFNTIYSYDTPLRQGDGADGPYGFFAMAGPGVPRLGEQSGVNLLDFAPTICHLMGVSISPDMESKVLMETI